jgi:peptide/nickel transport system substrate-binding protein
VEQPAIDLIPQLRSTRGVIVGVTDTSGNLGTLRLNHLHPPFDNPATRRLVLSTVRQSDFMTAVMGDQRSLWQDNVGVFTPGSALASDAGLAVIRGRQDFAQTRRDLAAAGYKGERLVMMGASDHPVLNPMCEVAGDMYLKMGFNLDYQSTDWGTIVQRRVSQEPPEHGGWSSFCTYTSGYDAQNPVSNPSINAIGRAGNFGWVTSSSRITLRNAWLDAPDLAARQKIGRDIQMQFLEDVPYVPLGKFLLPTAYRSDVHGVAKGSMIMFHNLRKST